MAVEVVETAPDQWQAVGTEVAHRGRIVEPGREPRLHRVLVRRGDVGQSVAERRAGMVGHGFGNEIRADLPVEDRAADKPGEHRRRAAGKRARREPAPAIRGRTHRLAKAGPARDRRPDALAQRGRGRIVGHLGLDAGAQARQLVTARGTVRAAQHMLLDLSALHRIELAVAVDGQQAHRFVAVHA